MNTSELIAAIDAEISRLQQARKLLAGSHNVYVNVSATRKRKRGTLSAEGRARIIAAQKKRWAVQKSARKR